MKTKEIMQNLLNPSIKGSFALLDKRAVLVEEIYRILTPNYFRIGQVDAPFVSITKEKIKRTIEENKPIFILLAYGGFKTQKAPSSPGIDWAEVLHLIFLVNTLYRISKIYEPGIHFEFSGDCEAMSYVNNIKMKNITSYINEFDQLLSYFNSIMPKNIFFTSKNFNKFYDYNEFKQIIDERFANASEPLISNEDLRKARNNFVFDGEENYTKLDFYTKEKLIKDSVVKDHLWLQWDYEQRSDYLEGGITIPLIHKKGVPKTISIKSYKGSDIQFWCGVGVFRDQEFKLPTIVSANNYFEHSKDYFVPKFDLSELI